MASSSARRARLASGCTWAWGLIPGCCAERLSSGCQVGTSPLKSRGSPSSWPPLLHPLLQASTTRVQLGVPSKTRPSLARSMCPPGAPSAGPLVSGSAANHPGTSAQGRPGSGQGAAGRVPLPRLLHTHMRTLHRVLRALSAHGLTAHATGKRHCLPGLQVARPGHGLALLGSCPGIGSGSAGWQRPRDKGTMRVWLTHSLNRSRSKDGRRTGAAPGG